MSSSRFLPPRVVALDGDDTLWHHEGLFSAVHAEFRDLLSQHSDAPAEQVDKRLLAIERQNLALYGYGVKGFVLSMVETAIEVTEGRIPSADIEKILKYGRSMLAHPVELIDGAEEVIDNLRSRDHEVWLITKGDLFDQESKIARSGLADAFDRIEIVSDKDEATYSRLLARHGALPEEFAMTGNSLRSDVLPVLGIGARAFHVPYHVTWAHEVVSEPFSASFRTLDTLRELPEALNDR